MTTQNLTDAQSFQLFLAEQVASTGTAKSPEELVRLWRARQQDEAETLAALAEGIADMQAGRVHAFDEVVDEIRHKHGWLSGE